MEKEIYETRPERELREALQARGQKLGIDFAIQYPIRHSFILDVAFPKEKVAVEVDGIHWHTSKQARKRDAFKNMILKQLGWKVIRFWENEIYDTVNECVDKILFEVGFGQVRCGLVG